jgi:hypothetical protein
MLLIVELRCCLLVLHLVLYFKVLETSFKITVIKEVFCRKSWTIGIRSSTTLWLLVSRGTPTPTMPSVRRLFLASGKEK